MSRWRSFVVVYLIVGAFAAGWFFGPQPAGPEKIVTLQAGQEIVVHQPVGRMGDGPHPEIRVVKLVIYRSPDDSSRGLTAGRFPWRLDIGGAHYFAAEE